MNYLLQEQRYFDERRFDPPLGYEQLSEGDQKIRHIQLHVSKMAVKVLSRSKELNTKEVIPDLAICRSQIMNISNLTPDDIEEGIPVFETLPINAIIRANGLLAQYLEPLEHGEVVPLHPTKRAAQYLHGAAMMLAYNYDIDLEQAQRARMEYHLGEVLPQPVVETSAATTNHGNDHVT